jgi:hypothetical protein
VPQGEDPARELRAVMHLDAEIEEPLEADHRPILGDPSLPQQSSETAYNLHLDQSGRMNVLADHPSGQGLAALVARPPPR